MYPAIELEDMAAPEFVWLEPAPMNSVSLEVGRVIEKSGMTLTAIARAMQTSVPALIRLKDPFYWGHSLKTLSALGEAVQAKVEVRFKPQPRVSAGGLRKSANMVQ
jgi:antitoxin HicB